MNQVIHNACRTIIAGQALVVAGTIRIRR